MFSVEPGVRTVLGMLQQAKGARVLISQIKRVGKTITGHDTFKVNMTVRTLSGRGLSVTNTL